MDDSDSTLKQADETSTGHFRGGMARAVFSAAIFGTIGAYLGKWLGKRGNCDKGQMAEPIMKWSMGAFWAVLAAYASLKASEPVASEQKPSVPEGEKGATIRDYATVGEMVQANVAPVSQVQKATTVAQGLVQENAPQLATQK